MTVTASSVGLERVFVPGSFPDATHPMQIKRQHDYSKLGVDLLNFEEKTPADVDISVVQLLVEALHNELIIWRRGSQTRFRAYLDTSEAMFIALVCSALDRNLQCPEDRLDDVLLVVKDDLIPALQAVLGIFIPWWSCDATVRNIALSKTARIIGRITNHVDTGHEDLFDALVPVLQCHMAPDIRVDAACAVATLFYYLEKRVKISGEVESLMISTLTTAALSVVEERLEEVVWALTYLVAFVPNTRGKIAKRRCSILAINKLMAHDNPAIRRHALDLTLCIVTNAESGVNRIGGQNMDLFLEELCWRSGSEKNPELQSLIVKNLEAFVRQAALRSTYFERGIEALKSIVFSDVVNDASSTKAATVFIEECRSPESSLSMLKSVLDFTTLPIAEVRTEALASLREAMKDPRIASSLLMDQVAFENVVMVIRYGCDQDCVQATAIIAHLASDDIHHLALSSNMRLLEAIVNLAKSNSNRLAQTHALDAILSLLSNSTTISSFLAFPDLLPYLITLVNSTTAEDSFKIKLVEAIMTMSKAILT